MDHHVIRYDVDFGHPKFGKYYPCPSCNKPAVDALSGLKPHERQVSINILETSGRPGAQAMKAAAERFVSCPTGFLSIYGGYGNGKTTTMQAIVNHLIARGIDARFMMAHELTEMVKAAIKSERDSPFEVVQRLAAVQVLVIDALDQGQWSEYNIVIQNYFFNERYRNEQTLGTVLSWNGPFGSLPSQLDSILSRLSQYPRVYNQDRDMRPDLLVIEE